MNPLFSEDDSGLAAFAEEDEEDEEDYTDSVEDDVDNNMSLLAALEIDPELSQQVNTIQMQAFKPPPGSMVVGDADGNDEGRGAP